MAPTQGHASLDQSIEDFYEPDSFSNEWTPVYTTNIKCAMCKKKPLTLYINHAYKNTRDKKQHFFSCVNFRTTCNQSTHLHTSGSPIACAVCSQLICRGHIKIVDKRQDRNVTVHVKCYGLPIRPHITNESICIPSNCLCMDCGGLIRKGSQARISETGNGFTHVSTSECYMPSESDEDTHPESDRRVRSRTEKHT